MSGSSRKPKICFAMQPRNSARRTGDWLVVSGEVDKLSTAASKDCSALTMHKG